MYTNLDATSMSAPTTGPEAAPMPRGGMRREGVGRSARLLLAALLLVGAGTAADALPAADVVPTPAVLPAPAVLPDSAVAPEAGARPDGADTAYAWGEDNAGQVSGPTGTPDVVRVAAGSGHSLLFLADGSVQAWGENQYGQAIVPAGLDDVVDVTAGRYDSLALHADGTVTAWGVTASQVPPGLADVVDVDHGVSHALAVHADGTVTGWGYDGYGQATVPVGLDDVVAVAAGHFHSVALHADGSVTAWGRNNQGQVDVPVGLADVVEVDAGANHTVARGADGTVVAWGADFGGQSTVPAWLDGVVEVAAARSDPGHRSEAGRHGGDAVEPLPPGHEFPVGQHGHRVRTGSSHNLAIGASNSVERIGGANRYETAALLARSFATADTVVVATGRDFPDSLAAGPLAAQEAAPLLLTARDSLPAASRDEVIRLDPARIVIVGGTVAVGQSVEDELRALAPTATIDRLAGTNRYHTAALIAAEIDQDASREVFVATGTNFPDALVLGSLAALHKAPLLLTQPTTLPTATRDALEGLTYDDAWIAGGTVAISDPVAAEVAAIGNADLQRLAGPNRYATAAAVLAEFPSNCTVMVATGAQFPDALAASPVAATTGSPVAIVAPDHVPADVQAQLERLVAAHPRPDLTMIGGELALSHAVEVALTALLP